jgi:hypothetical protein
METSIESITCVVGVGKIKRRALINLLNEGGGAINAPAPTNPSSFFCFPFNKSFFAKGPASWKKNCLDG